MSARPNITVFLAPVGDAYLYAVPVFQITYC